MALRVELLDMAPDWWSDEISQDADASHYRDERRISVAAVVSELGARDEFAYRNEIGDGWQHGIVVECHPTLGAMDRRRVRHERIRSELDKS